ncbi:MAG: hypothetical protein JXR32_09375 [Anaerolineaceae bacterium]|nr:hypothetical protein [Anaerolineaceae bacterium]
MERVAGEAALFPYGTLGADAQTDSAVGFDWASQGQSGFLFFPLHLVGSIGLISFLLSAPKTNQGDLDRPGF